jgi:hypothetical protein
MREIMRSQSEFVPRGVLRGTFAELFSSGCIQTGADVCKTLAEASDRFGSLFIGLSLETNGNLCNGCPALNGGACKAFKLYHTSKQMPPATSPRNAERRAVKRCACGFKVRGPNHEHGKHHVEAMARK